MGILAAQSVSLTGLWLQLGLTLLILALFAGLAFLAVKYLKPGFRSAGQASRMCILSRLPLSSSAQLYLVKIDEREVLLGVTDSHITVLSESAASGGTSDE